jgi:phosphoglycolate phosphatase
VTEGSSRVAILDGIDLAIFDKDGTLIDFHLMWSGWVHELADRIAIAQTGGGGGQGGGGPDGGGRPRLDDLLGEILGVDPETGRVLPHGALAATPMARLREAVTEAVAGTGVPPAEAARIVRQAWHAPDPVRLTHPVTHVAALFGHLRAAGIRIAVATSDDRGPTERTLAHLGVEGFVEALACADDEHAVKPDPAAVRWICATLGVPEARTAVIGDSPADLAMGRAAGVGRVIGVLTGVGDRQTLERTADVVIDSVAELLPPA